MSLAIARASDGDRLLAQAIAVLKKLGYPQPKNLRVIIQGDRGIRLTFDGIPEKGDLAMTSPERPDHSNASWLWLSPLEESVVRVLIDTAATWITAEEIATAIGESNNSDLRAILRNMTARGILESAQGRGYRLALPR